MNSDISHFSFEDAIKDLGEITKHIEDVGVSLNDSIDLYERGSMLSKHCQNILNNAQMKISKIENSNNIEEIVEDIIDTKE